MIIPLARPMQVVLALLLMKAATSCAKADAPPPEGAFQLQNGSVMTLLRSDEGYRVVVADNGFTRRIESCGKGRWCAYNGRDPGKPLVLTLAFDRDANGFTGVGEWRPENAAVQTLRQIHLSVRDFNFKADDGVRLNAKLVLPEGEGPHPLLVLVHGSGKEAATKVWQHPYQFAAYGIATLVFDKRGTGNSAGAFTMDFQRLAADVNAAIDVGKTQPNIDATRIALSGYSQGGWVAPLAASKRKDLAAVLANYGLAVSPIEEERSEAMLPFANDDAATRTQAQRLVDASMTLLGNHFEGDWDGYKKLCANTAKATWRKRMVNDNVNRFCKHPAAMIRTLGPGMLTPGIDFNYDPMPVLRKVTAPMLWTIAADDIEAPPMETLTRLKTLRDDERRSIAIRVFKGADHGMFLFKLGTNGERLYLGVHPQFVQAQVQFLGERFGMPPAQFRNDALPDPAREH